MTEITKGIRNAYPDLLYRAFWFGVDYGEMASQVDLNDLVSFQRRCETLAAEWLERAERRELRGALDLAASARQQAAVYFHFGALKSGGENHLALSRRIASLCRPHVMSDRLGHSGTEVESLSINGCDGFHVRHISTSSDTRAVVWLFGGLDSRKEIELAGVGREMLRQGLDIVFLDMPGHGTSFDTQTLAADFDRTVDIADQWFSQRYGRARVCALGLSMGGHLALRAASLLEGISVVSIGGFFDADVARHLSSQIAAHLRKAIGDQTEGISERWLDLAQLRAPKGKSLHVQGSEDRLVDADQVNRMRHWMPELTLWEIPGGEHVCTSRFSWLLPDLASWIRSESLS